MHFASLLFGGFITAIVVNPPERKLAKRTSVQWFKVIKPFLQPQNHGIQRECGNFCKPLYRLAGPIDFDQVKLLPLKLFTWKCITNFLMRQSMLPGPSSGIKLESP